MFLKIVCVVCSPNGNIQRLATLFVEKVEIFSSPGDYYVVRGGGGHIWNSAHAFYVKSTASEV